MTTTLLILPALARVAVAILAVGKERLAVFKTRVGIAAYNARVNSRLFKVSPLILLTLTAPARGMSIAQRSQTPLEAPIYFTHVSARIRLWPLIRLRVVLDEVVVTGVIVQLEVKRQDAMARPLGAIRLDDGRKPDSHGDDASGARRKVGESDARSRGYYCITCAHGYVTRTSCAPSLTNEYASWSASPASKSCRMIKAINTQIGEPVNEAVP